MTPREYLDVLRTRWRIVVAGLILGAGAAIGITSITPPVYASDVVLYVSAQPGADVATAVEGSDLSTQRVTTYTEILGSEKLAQEVAADPAIGLPAGDLAGRINVSNVQGTVLLTATVTDGSPEGAAAIANLLAAKFIASIAELEQPRDPNALPVVSARVFKAATPNPQQVAPSPTLNYAAGVALGLILGFGVALVRHSLDTSVKKRNELEKALGAPVLGVIGLDPKIVKSPLVVVGDPQGAPAEAFRQLRTNVQFVDIDRANKVILLTSPSAAEGKSTTVCNLALALAETGTRVLIIDADLRRPTIATCMNVDNSVGLTNVLVNRLPLMHAIRPSGPALDILPSGPTPPNPSELLGSEQMARMLGDLRLAYDIIIIDTSPLLPVTDAAVLTPQVDGVVVVARQGRTTLPQLQSAKEALEAVSARILGSVLTMVPNLGKNRYTTYSAGGEGLSDAAATRRVTQDRGSAPTVVVDTGQRNGAPSPGPRARVGSDVDAGTRWDDGAPR